MNQRTEFLNSIIWRQIYSLYKRFPLPSIGGGKEGVVLDLESKNFLSSHQILHHHLKRPKYINNLASSNFTF